MCCLDDLESEVSTLANQLTNANSKLELADQIISKLKSENGILTCEKGR